VLGLLAAGAVLRVAACFCHVLSGDDATVALVASHVLRGENLPAFFYRQAYMGSLNGLHLVPALAVFGPSVWTVRLNAVAWSLLFPLGLYLLGRRLFDETTGRVALLLAAVPPYLLTYWSGVAEPHFETNLFGVALFLLAAAALEAERGPRRTRLLLVFGLTGGLAWWANFKAVEVLLPALLVLWRRDPRLPLTGAGLGLAAGLAAGSLPVWLHHAVRGGESGHAGHLFGTSLALSGDRLGALLTTVVPNLAGTYFWTPDTGTRRAALAGAVLAHALGAATLVAAARRGAAGEPAGRVQGRRLLVLALVTPFALLYASRFVADFGRDTGRYVLPAYIPLLLGTAALLVRLGRRARPAAVLATAGLLAFHLWTHAAFLWPLDPAARAARRAAEATREAVLAHLASAQAVLVDDFLASPAWAFHLPGRTVAEASAEVYLPAAVDADAAEDAAVLVRNPVPWLDHQLVHLGATFRTTAFGELRVLDRIRVAPRAYRALPRRAWRVPGDPAPPGAPPAVADGDLTTAWPPEAGAARALVVDLGALRAVARVVWWPALPVEHSLPLVVAVSPDGVAWTALGVQPSGERRAGFVAAGRPVFRPRNAWLEVRAGAGPVRYLRIGLADPAAPGPWGVAELFAYEDAGAAPGPLPAPLLAGRLARLGVRRLLADPVTSARVHRLSGGAIAVLTANAVLDSHGRSEPPARLTEPVRLRASDALLVPAEEAEEVLGRLAAAGVGVRAEPLGADVLLHAPAPADPAGPCQRAAWRARALGGGLVLVDVTLPGPRLVEGLHVEHPSVALRDVPLPRVARDDGGGDWRPVEGVRRATPWHWAGRTLLAFPGQAQDLAWPPAGARALRVALRLPGPEAVTSLCVRGRPAPGPA
jgi:hypothetical protein